MCRGRVHLIAFVINKDKRTYLFIAFAENSCAAISDILRHYNQQIVHHTAYTWNRPLSQDFHFLLLLLRPRFSKIPPITHSLLSRLFPLLLSLSFPLRLIRRIFRVLSLPPLLFHLQLLRLPSSQLILNQKPFRLLPHIPPKQISLNII